MTPATMSRGRLRRLRCDANVCPCTECAVLYVCVHVHVRMRACVPVHAHVHVRVHSTDVCGNGPSHDNVPLAGQVPELRNSPVPFSWLSFSNDGKLLCAVAEGRVLVLDAFGGKVLQSFSNGVTEAGAAPEASLSHDGAYVLSGELCTATAQHAYRPPWMSSSRHVNDMCTTGHTPRRQPLNAGCEDKSVRVWSVASGAQVAAWSKHPGVPYCAKWAPRRLLAASACGAVCLWIPGREAVAAALGSVR
jgi:WD40 repeat protein